MDKTAKIKRVYLDDLSHNGEPDVTLTVHLENGHRISLNLNNKASDPQCAQCKAGGFGCDPETDGSRMYWPDGPSAALEDIVEAVKSDSGGVIAKVEAYEGKPEEIDVTLAGGHMISLALADGCDDGGVPQTDGARVFWKNGSSMTLNDMLAIVCGEEKFALPEQGGDPVSFGRNSRGRWRIAAGLAACAAIAIFVVLSRQGSVEPEIRLDDEPVPLGSMFPVIVYPHISEIELPENTAEVRLDLKNPESNASLLVFEIILAGGNTAGSGAYSGNSAADRDGSGDGGRIEGDGEFTGETIYISELVEPGEELGNAVLLRTLEKGEYKAVLKISAYNQEGFTEAGSESRDVIIRVIGGK